MRILAIGAILGLAAASTGCDKEPPVQPTGCTSVALSSTSLSLDADGGARAVEVTIPEGCGWTALTQVPWISVTSGASGSGPGAVTLAIAANGGASSRAGTVIVAGVTVTVLQAGRPPSVVCTYMLTPEAAEFTDDGGSGTVSINAPDECDWSAVSDADWLTIQAGASGRGSSVLTYAVGPNQVPAARTAHVNVGDRQLTVTQAADLGACVYSVAPVEFSPCMAATELAVSITTSRACPWTAAPNAPWISVVTPSATSGTGPLRIRITESYDAPRLGIVMVRWPTPTEGQNVRIAQAGCRYNVTQSAFTIGAGGGPLSFDVVQQSQPADCGGPLQNACRWTASSDVPWLVITTAMPQTGDNPVRFLVEPNATDATRVGTIRVRDQSVVVTQSR